MTTERHGQPEREPRDHLSLALQFLPDLFMYLNLSLSFVKSDKGSASPDGVHYSQAHLGVILSNA